jgi:hypothetical protein
MALYHKEAAVYCIIKQWWGLRGASTILAQELRYHLVARTS